MSIFPLSTSKAVGCLQQRTPSGRASFKNVSTALEAGEGYQDPYRTPRRGRQRFYGSRRRPSQSGTEWEQRPGQTDYQGSFSHFPPTNHHTEYYSDRRRRAQQTEYQPRDQRVVIETARGQRNPPYAGPPSLTSYGGRYDSNRPRLGLGPEFQPGYRGGMARGLLRPQAQRFAPFRPPRQSVAMSQRGDGFDPGPRYMPSLRNPAPGSLPGPGAMPSYRPSAQNPSQHIGRTRSRSEFEQASGDRERQGRHHFESPPTRRRLALSPRPSRDDDPRQPGERPTRDRPGPGRSDRLARIRRPSERFYHSDPQLFRSLPHGQSADAFTARVLEGSLDRARADQHRLAAGREVLPDRRVVQMAFRVGVHARRWHAGGGGDRGALEDAYATRVLLHMQYRDHAAFVPDAELRAFHASLRRPGSARGAAEQRQDSPSRTVGSGDGDAQTHSGSSGAAETLSGASSRAIARTVSGASEPTQEDGRARRAGRHGAEAAAGSGVGATIPQAIVPRAEPGGLAERVDEGGGVAARGGEAGAAKRPAPRRAALRLRRRGGARRARARGRRAARARTVRRGPGRAPRAARGRASQPTHPKGSSRAWATTPGRTRGWRGPPARARRAWGRRRGRAAPAREARRGRGGRSPPDSREQSEFSVERRGAGTSSSFAVPEPRAYALPL